MVERYLGISGTKITPSFCRTPMENVIKAKSASWVSPLDVLTLTPEELYSTSENNEVHRLLNREL